MRKSEKGASIISANGSWNIIRPDGRTIKTHTSMSLPSAPAAIVQQYLPAFYGKNSVIIHLAKLTYCVFANYAIVANS